MRILFCRPAGLAMLLLLLADTSRAQSAAPARGPEGKKTIATGPPFGLRQSQSLEYQLRDPRGKATGSWRYRVLRIGTDTAGKKNSAVTITTAALKSGLYDVDNLIVQQEDLTYFHRRDTTFTDGLGEINYDGLKSARDRLLTYQGTPLAWPDRPTVGSRLADGGVVVQVSSPSVAIAKVKTTLRQRRIVAGPRPVTVPAGTFSCYSVESQRELATAARADLVLKSIGREVDYYDPAVGIIKTEYFDKSGKLVQTRVLTRR